MPLSVKGNQIKQKFLSRYGSKKGERIFYATENSKPAFKRVVRGV